MDRTVFEAAESGDFDRMIEALKEHQNLDHLLTPQHNTVLHVAARFESNKSFAERVLKLCPKLLVMANKDGETPLHVAAKSRNPDMVGLFLGFASRGDIESQPHNVDARTLLRTRDSARGETALHFGVRNGHLGVAELLLSADSELLEMLNDASESPLFLAVEGGFLDIARHIVAKHGPHVCDGSNGMNALHAAVIRTHHATTLENHVPDLSLENLRRLIRSSLLHLEEYFRRRTQKVDTVVDIIELLLQGEEGQRAALLEKQDKLINWTPLHFAAYLGHLKAAKLILAHKCSNVAYLRDKEGMSALQIAAKEGHVGVMKEIIRQKPEACDLVDNRGWTALHVAVVNEKLNVVKYILKTQKLEFLLNIADKDGNTPLHLAVGRRKRWIMKILVDDVRVDKRARNLMHLKPIDILRTNADIGELIRSWFTKQLEKQGGQESLRSIVQRVEHGNQVTDDDKPEIQEATNDNKKVLSDHHHHSPEAKTVLSTNGSDHNNKPKSPPPPELRKADKAMKSRRLKKISNTHLLVAALIATVTFTAAFTIPGGYENNDGSGKGMAVLSNRPFFKAFVVADSVAFYCSTASVLLQFFSSVELNYHLVLRFTRIAATLTYVSIFGMVVAFTSGLRVVMPSSSGLPVYTLVMGGFCVFLFIIGCL